MSEGYTDIRLKGGKRDGTVIERVPARHVPANLSMPTPVYATQTATGQILRERVQDRLGADWISYDVEIYAKTRAEEHAADMVFSFVGTRAVTRCTATTHQGGRCNRPAKDGVNYCSLAHKTNR